MCTVYSGSSLLSGRVVVAGYCAGAVARGPVLIPITGMAGGDLMGFDAMQLAVRDQRPDTVDAPEAGARAHTSCSS